MPMSRNICNVFPRNNNGRGDKLSLSKMIPHWIKHEELLRFVDSVLNEDTIQYNTMFRRCRKRKSRNGLRQLQSWFRLEVAQPRPIDRPIDVRGTTK